MIYSSIKILEVNMEYLELNNKVKIPVFGLGCGGIYNRIKLFNRDSINLFNVYFRTMKRGLNLLYDSEATGYHQYILGESLRLNKKVRKDIFVCTKLSNTQQRTMSVEDAIKDSLKKLNVDYVDLYLMHWPQTETFVDSYLQMEEVYKKGYTRAIGVCNFNQHHLEEIEKYAHIVPAINQFEIHPLFTQTELIDHCRKKGIQPMAYTPLGRMHDVLIKAKVLQELSKKYEKSVPQIIVRWDIQKNICVIPKTTKLHRVNEYLETFDFSLTNDEIKAIDDMNDNVRLSYNPDKCDFSRM